jgi:hypothetical protein
MKKHFEETNNQTPAIPEMTFLSSAMTAIQRTVGNRHAETGGILLGSREDWIVQKFVFDPHGSCHGAAYDPNVEYLNKVVKEEWQENKLAFLGFVHSHPPGVRRLSGDFGNGTGDIGYLRRIFRAMPSLDYFLVPIVFSEADAGEFEMLPFIAERSAPELYWLAELRQIESYPNNEPEIGEKASVSEPVPPNEETKSKVKSEADTAQTPEQKDELEQPWREPISEHPGALEMAALMAFPISPPSKEKNGKSKRTLITLGVASMAILTGAKFTRKRRSKRSK